MKHDEIHPEIIKNVDIFMNVCFRHFHLPRFINKLKKIIIFRKNKIKHNFKNMILKESSFEVLNSYKYMGCVINCKLEDNNDINDKLN